MTRVTIQHKKCGTNIKVERLDWESTQNKGQSRDLNSYRCWKCREYGLREEFNEIRIGRG